MDKLLSSKKNTDILLLAESFAVFVFAVLAVHDTNTATGTGFWFLLKFNVAGRTFWDIAVDAVLLFSVIALTVIPVFILKGKISDAVLFFMANAALNIYIRPDRLLSVFTGSDATGTDAAYALLSFLPGILLICAFSILISAPRMVRFFGISVTLLAFGICIPSLAEITRFFAGYFALMPYLAFCSSGRDEKNRALIRLLPGCLFCLCGVWRLILVLSTYHV